MRPAPGLREGQEPQQQQLGVLELSFLHEHARKDDQLKFVDPVEFAVDAQIVFLRPPVRRARGPGLEREARPEGPDQAKPVELVDGFEALLARVERLKGPGHVALRLFDPRDADHGGHEGARASGRPRPLDRRGEIRHGEIHAVGFVVIFARRQRRVSGAGRDQLLITAVDDLKFVLVVHDQIGHGLHRAAAKIDVRPVKIQVAREHFRVVGERLPFPDQGQQLLDFPLVEQQIEPHHADDVADGRLLLGLRRVCQQGLRLFDPDMREIEAPALCVIRGIKHGDPGALFAVGLGQGAEPRDAGVEGAHEHELAELPLDQAARLLIPKARQVVGDGLGVSLLVAVPVRRPRMKLADPVGPRLGEEFIEKFPENIVVAVISVVQGDQKLVAGAHLLEQAVRVFATGDVVAQRGAQRSQDGGLQHELPFFLRPRAEHLAQQILLDAVAAAVDAHRQILHAGLFFHGERDGHQRRGPPLGIIFELLDVGGRDVPLHLFKKRRDLLPAETQVADADAQKIRFQFVSREAAAELGPADEHEMQSGRQEVDQKRQALEDLPVGERLHVVDDQHAVRRQRKGPVKDDFDLGVRLEQPLRGKDVLRIAADPGQNRVERGADISPEGAGVVVPGVGGQPRARQPGGLGPRLHGGRLAVAGGSRHQRELALQAVLQLLAQVGPRDQKQPGFRHIDFCLDQYGIHFVTSNIEVRRGQKAPVFRGIAPAGLRIGRAACKTREPS